MSFLPSTEHGYLPYLLLCFVVMGSTHSVVCYLAPHASLRQFSGPRAPPKHPLNAHVYAFKNFYTAMIRGYAAYNIQNPQLYDLALLTFMAVFVLFSSELFIFHTIRMKEGQIPIAMALVAIYWMLTQRNWYHSRGALLGN